MCSSSKKATVALLTFVSGLNGFPPRNHLTHFPRESVSDTTEKAIFTDGAVSAPSGLNRQNPCQSGLRAAAAE